MGVNDVSQVRLDIMRGMLHDMVSTDKIALLIDIIESDARIHGMVELYIGKFASEKTSKGG